MKPLGKVILIGAGPGDPGLLTLKGKRWIEQADVLIYDYLASERFLDYVRVDTEKIFVGKKREKHTLSQQQINELIIKKAKEGKLVVRLKGGDPFIFGRGGEEAEELVKEEIPFEIVPGVTTAISVPAYAGIPLTHRNCTSTVAFITGHEDPTKGYSSIAWDKITTGIGTLVFYMGITNLKNIVNNLLAHGRKKSTPVGIIRWGSTYKQETVIGTLENIVELAKKRKVNPPSLIVVGDVVKLNDKLNWFESKPLFKKQILVTRASDQAGNFYDLLESQGARPIPFPTIKIVPPNSWGPIDKEINSIEKYDWLIFTSANGVKYFLERLKENQKDIRDLKGVRICTIGPKTADVLLKLGIRIDFMPSEFIAEAILEGIGDDIKGKKVLIPRASMAREILPQKLAKMGAIVKVVDAYKTICPEEKTGQIQKMLLNKEIDVITFTSSSTVKNFVNMFEEEKFPALIAGITIACIGPITAATAKKHGLKTSILPENYTIEALTEALSDFFQKSKPV